MAEAMGSGVGIMIVVLVLLREGSLLLTDYILIAGLLISCIGTALLLPTKNGGVNSD